MFYAVGIEATSSLKSGSERIPITGSIPVLTLQTKSGRHKFVRIGLVRAAEPKLGGFWFGIYAVDRRTLSTDCTVFPQATKNRASSKPAGAQRWFVYGGKWLPVACHLPAEEPPGKKQPPGQSVRTLETTARHSARSAHRDSARVTGSSEQKARAKNHSPPIHRKVPRRPADKDSQARGQGSQGRAVLAVARPSARWKIRASERCC